MVLENLYITKQDIIDLSKAQNYADIGKVALALQERYPDPLTQVCGPISSGGLGSIDKNLDVFERTIEKLTAQGRIVYDQMPLERDLVRLYMVRGSNYQDDTLLEDIYGPLFASGKITQLYFIAGWEDSYGSNWEYKRGLEHNIPIAFLAKDFLER